MITGCGPAAASDDDVVTDRPATVTCCSAAVVTAALPSDMTDTRVSNRMRPLRPYPSDRGEPVARHFCNYDCSRRVRGRSHLAHRCTPLVHPARALRLR